MDSVDDIKEIDTGHAHLHHKHFSTIFISFIDIFMTPSPKSFIQASPEHFPHFWFEISCTVFPGGLWGFPRPDEICSLSFLFWVTPSSSAPSSPQRSGTMSALLLVLCQSACQTHAPFYTHLGTSPWDTWTPLFEGTAQSRSETSNQKQKPDKNNTNWKHVWLSAENTNTTITLGM